MGLLDRAKAQVIRFDEAVDSRVDRVRGNPMVDRVMYTASELGDWSLIWHLLGAAQAMRPSRSASSAVRVSAILGVESALVNGVIKSAFRRHRPVWESERPRPHRLRTPRSSSFPSGHASSAFTALGVLAPRDPLAPAYLAVAVVVASSRVYVRIHHASDVLAGAALGVALGAIANKAWPTPPRSRHRQTEAAEPPGGAAPPMTSGSAKPGAAEGCACRRELPNAAHKHTTRER